MPSGSTRFHWVRHGHTDALGRSLTGRAPGVGLNAQGREAAVRLALSLTSTDISAVLSSPRLRTRQTAEQIANATGCVVLDEPALDEVDFGDWTGASFAELDLRPDWQAWNRLRSLSSGAGETMFSVQARVLGLLQRLRNEVPDGEVVLVSHADVLRSVLAYVLGVPIDLMQRIELGPAGRSVVRLSDDEVRVEAVNLPTGG